MERLFFRTAGESHGKALIALVEGMPASYTQIARSEVYTQPVSLLLPGALQDFDLADVMAVLAPRPLLVMDLQDPTTRRMSLGEAEVAVKPARDAYERAKAQDELSVRVEPLEAEISKALEAWIGKR